MSGFRGTPTGFAVVDVETTGFSPEDDRIVEVGIVTLDNRGEEVGSFSSLIDPRRGPGPTHVHGISTAMLSEAPTYGAVHAYLAALLSGRVVVGHNVDGFDLPFLRAECLRLGRSAPILSAIPSVDTWAVAHTHLGLEGRATLAECCASFGLSWDDHHSALGDARVTAALFRAMRARVGDAALGITVLLDAAASSLWPGASGMTPPWCRRARSVAL
jgi:DNA polymerase III epsilon subunit family exonuclease